MPSQLACLCFSTAVGAEVQPMLVTHPRLSFQFTFAVVAAASQCLQYRVVSMGEKPICLSACPLQKAIPGLGHRHQHWLKQVACSCAICISWQCSLQQADVTGSNSGVERLPTLQASQSLHHHGCIKMFASRSLQKAICIRTCASRYGHQCVCMLNLTQGSCFLQVSLILEGIQVYLHRGRIVPTGSAAQYRYTRVP